MKKYHCRNPDIVVKKCPNLSVAQAMAANPTNIKKWFEEYIAALAHFGIQSPDQIWSGDENCLQNIPAVGKVLGHRNTTAHRQVSGKLFSQSSVD